LFNEHRVYFLQMPWGYSDDWQTLFPVEYQTAPFSFFINEMLPRTWKDINVLEDTQAFVFLCTALPECSFDTAQSKCVTEHPDQTFAESNGHFSFFVIVFACAAVRAAFELVCATLVAVSVARDANTGHRVLLQSSALCPLLFLRPRTRAAWADIVVSDSLPSDHLWRLLFSGLLVSIPMLFVNIYYLLNIAQTGLGVSDWASLALGMLLVPRLVGQAAWGWWASVRDAREAHYAERASTGAEFDAEIESWDGGSADDADADDVRLQPYAPLRADAVACVPVVSVLH
jgi:hypothetical protein